MRLNCILHIDALWLTIVQECFELMCVNEKINSEVLKKG